MNDEKGNNNGNTILLTVIGVATLLVALVGATFAYFSASISNNQQESILLSTATPVGLQYLGEELKLENIVPGASTEGTFKVVNPETVTTGEGDSAQTVTNKVQQTYDLDIVIDKNELTTTYKANDGRAQEDTDAALLADQLRVYITSNKKTAGKKSDGTAETTIMKPIQYNDATNNRYNLTTASGSIKVVDDQQIAIGEEHEYSIKVEFAELGIPQDANQGKAFEAHIEIGDAKSFKEA